MELGKETSRKLFLFLLIFGLLFEAILVILIFVKFRNPLNETIEDIVKLTESKIIILNKKLNSNCNTLVYKYVSDLKLISGHMIQFNTGNQTSNFLKNYDKKQWIFADNYNYPNQTVDDERLNNRYYNESNGLFNYIDLLEEKFKDNYNHSDIINTLFKEHEFDIIGVYNYSVTTLKPNVMHKSYYFISGLKSVYIRRYLVKRNNTDYIRFVITNRGISFIYPYDRFENSRVIQMFKKENISLVHEYNSKKCKEFKSALNTSLISFYSHFTNDIIVFCIVTFNYIDVTVWDKTQTLCSEIKTSAFLDSFFWKDQVDLGLSIVFLNKSEIEPIYLKNSDYYNLMKKTFQSEKFGKYQFSDKIRLFHIIYYSLFSKYENYNDFDNFYEEILKEYKIIKEELVNKINELEESFCDNRISDRKQHISFVATKTNCYNDPNNHEMKCQKDSSLFVIYVFLMETRQLDKQYYIDIEGTTLVYPIFYSITIIESNQNITNKNIISIMDNKIIKLLFFFISTLVSLVILIWLLIEIINNILLSSIHYIMSGLKVFDEMIEENNKQIDINKILKYENKILIANKEMEILNNISNNIKKMIILQIVMNYNDNSGSSNNNKYLNNSRLCNIILKMNNSTMKEKSLMILGYHHFKKKLYKISEDEFNLVINGIINKEKNINLKNDTADSDLKETIKRFNDITYLNDNSVLKGINETILPNIKIKFAKQKIVYLHGMCLFNEATDSLYTVKKNINNNINQINNYTSNKMNINISFQRAIKDFDECRNINKLLGSNPIKEIFSLIMMAKCHIQLKEYKNAGLLISEALDLFFELEKVFKDTKNINYNPCIMLFVLNNIFQTIMYTLSQICYFSYRYHACIYIIFKIFETSPFIIKDIFYNCSFMLQNILNRSKLKKNSIIFDNIKKYYSKIFTRLYIRYYNNINEINKIKMIYSLSLNKRMSTKTEFITGANKTSLIDTSEPRKNSQKNKMSFPIINNNSSNKLINICVSEKILSQNNGIVLKDVLINYIDECFYDNNDNDKFSYVQFSHNGKKNIFIKPEMKEIFMQKLKIDNSDKNENNNFYCNSEYLFNEFYNLLNDFIELCKYNNNDETLSNNAKFNSDDNIILMFINTEDIRFKDKDECRKIVYELNKNNFSLYLISYEEFIQPEKIKNIKSFMSGLFDAHFFQIKNYQQIKQIFLNIASKPNKEDIFDYNYENIDLIL